jgi:hypothetical protein
MNRLTQEQIKTLKNVFESYPEDYQTKSVYTSLEGIQKQLDDLQEKSGYIFYISNVVHLSDKEAQGEHINFTIEKMKVGEQNESN